MNSALSFACYGGHTESARELVIAGAACDTANEVKYHRILWCGYQLLNFTHNSCNRTDELLFTVLRRVGTRQLQNCYWTLVQTGNTC